MNILLIIIIVAVVAGLLITMEMITARSDEPTTFESNGTLLTPVERSFMAVLEQALDSRYRVFAKVRLGDLLRPAKGISAGKRIAAQNRVNQKYVDFVVCTANELTLVGVLELNDLLPKSEIQTGRDEYVKQVLAMAGIPLLRFPAQRKYTVQEVRAQLADMLCINKFSGVSSATHRHDTSVIPVLDAILESIPVQHESVAPDCPECKATMMKRQVMRGQNAGKHFWACSTFPLCRQIAGITEGC